MSLTYVNLPYIKESNKNQTKEILEDAFYSSLSIEEYCSKTGTSIDRIKKNCIKYIKSNNPDKVLIGTSLLERSSYDFIQRLKKDVLCDLTKEDADIFDYLSITRLQARDFREVMLGLIPKETVVMILTQLDLYRLDPFNNKHAMINRSAILNGRIVLNGIEASFENKQKVLNYLDENNLPEFLFNAALRKHLNGNLILDEKKLIKE